MKESSFTFTSAEGCQIHAFKKVPGKVKAVVQIVHGMAEHKDRYLFFADYMTKNNIAVYIHDHLGHGDTAAGIDNTGMLPAKINGLYYIHYVGNYSWSHFEAN